MNLMSSIVLLLAVAIMSVWEQRYYPTFYTPFNVAAWPIAIISLLVNTLAVQFGFLPVTVRSNLFLLVNLTIIGITGISYGVFSANFLQKKFPDYRSFFNQYYSYRYIFWVLETLVLLIGLMRIMELIAPFGWWYMATDFFEEDFNKGAVAHLLQLGKAVVLVHMLAVWGKKKNIIDKILIILMISLIIAMRIKYHIIWVVFIAYIIKNYNLSTIEQLKKLRTIFYIVIFVFVFNYISMFFVFSKFSISDQRMWETIIGSFFNYFFSGPIILEYWLDLPYSQPWWAIFSVFINIKNMIIGNPEVIDFVKYVSPGFLPVSKNITSNVGTSYGTYYLIGGIGFSFLMSFIMAFFNYLFFIRSWKKISPIALYINATFLAMWLLSFFGQYFTILSTYEMTIFIILIFLPFLSKAGAEQISEK